MWQLIWSVECLWDQTFSPLWSMFPFLYSFVFIASKWLLKNYTVVFLTTCVLWPFMILQWLQDRISAAFQGLPKFCFLLHGSYSFVGDLIRGACSEESLVFSSFSVTVIQNLFLVKLVVVSHTFPVVPTGTPQLRLTFLKLMLVQLLFSCMS